MVKLSQQLQQQTSQQAVRQSRTERVREQQEVERQKQQYEANKQKAEELQKTEFANITSVEEYRTKYNKLSADLKQFFSTPEQVEEQRSSDIASAKTSVAEKIAYYKKEMAEDKEYYDKKEDYYEDKAEYYLKKGNEEKADYYYKKAQQYEDKGDEKKEYYQGIIKGLQEGQTKLNKNQYLTYESIFDYAKDLGRYERDVEEAKNENREASRIQERKISDLKEAGYTAFVIEKSTSAGQPESVSLEYLNKATGDWMTVATVKDVGKVDVSSLTKLGYSEPTERSLFVGGKEFKYQARTGVYKTDTGSIVTAYGDTGLTEQGLIKEAQDKAYEEWVSTRTERPFYTDTKTEPTALVLGDKTYVPTTDFIGYVDQGTISTEPKYVEIPTDKEYKKVGISAGWDWVKKQYAKIPSGTWTFNIGGLGGTGLQAYKDPTAKYSINLTEQIGKAKDWLGGKVTDVDVKLTELETVEPKLTALEEKYQAQGQSRFEDLYAKEIIYGELTPEQAQEEFEKSESYKIWQEQYSKEYEETFKGAIARENIGYKSALQYGSQKFIENLGIFALGRIETPKATLETGAVVGGIVLTYGQLSPAVASAVGWGLTGATGVYGAYKFLSPKSTPSEVFGGAVMLGTAVATAGYGAYKYLRQPVVKTVKIKAPKPTAKATQTKGYDVKYITEQGEISKVVYPQQKLSQVGVAGRRTIVTTKGRLLSNKFWKALGTPEKYTTIESNAIYRGIPYQQLPKTYTVEGLRGTYTVTAGKSGYQKAYDLLKQYGYTDYQATATLRYTAPRVYEQYLKSGEIFVKGTKATGQFTYELTQPVIDVDKTLGIKTRGGGTVTDYVKVQRQLLQTPQGQKFVLENQLIKTYGSTLEGAKTFKQVQEKWSLGVATTSDVKTGFDVLGKSDFYKVYEKISYKDVVSGSRVFLKGTGKLSQDLARFNIETLPSETAKSRSILIEKIKDLTGESYGVTFVSDKKTPFSKTFGVTDNVEDILTKVKTARPSVQTDIAKVIDKLEDVKVTTPTQSQYYGTGLYERTAGGVSPQQLQILQNELKTVAIPDVQVDVLKDIIKVKVGADVGSLTRTANLMALGSGLAQRTDLKLKTDLKVQSALKNLLKTDVGLKDLQIQELGVKTSPELTTQLKSMLELDTMPIGLETPTFEPSEIKPIDTIIPKGVIIPFLEDRLTKKARGKAKGVFDFAYLPDFTSRALGLEAETVSEKQAQKKLKQVLSGLEIRRGIKIK